MPGLYGRVGGYGDGDAAGVAALLRHFPYYRSAERGDARGWLGWAGIGDPDARLGAAGPDGLIAGYHGDGAGDGDAEAAAARLAAVKDLADRDPLALAERLDGSFAAAVCEPATGRAVLVTDVFGHHRVYWRVHGGALHFASELKGLLGWPDLPCEPDDACLRDFLNYAYPLGDRTALRDVRVLPPASVLRFADGRAEVGTYWSPAYAPGSAPDDALAEEGYELFRRSFAAKTRGDRPLLVPVSGGLDSRILLGEAVARGHRVATYTYGHARSREARVARHVMQAAGVDGPFLALDDFPDPEENLVRTAWFGEGMLNLTMVGLTAANGLLDALSRDHLFVNGIYGGPTNFSSIYHKPGDLVDDLSLDERVRAVGRTIFAGTMNTARARHLLQPDFARACEKAYWPVLREQFEPWTGVSPLFGHQKDAFLVANRLFRFMNQVDLNRYFWDECLPLTSFSLYRFYLRLPEEPKFGRRLHRRIVADRFPDLAAVENFTSGRTIGEELAGLPPVRRSTARARLGYLAGRLTRGRVSRADPESYQAPDHYLRSSRRLYEFTRDVLADRAWRSGRWFDQPRVLDYLDRTRRGANLAAAVNRVLAWELWLRQLASRSKETA